MKKHFLLLLMAFFSLAGYAEELDVTKFVSANVPYGTRTLEGILTEDEDYALEADYDIDLTHFYTSNTGAGETAVVSGTGESAVNNLMTARPGLYYIKISGTGTYNGSVIYKDFRIYPSIVTIDFDNDLGKTYGDTDEEEITYTLTLNGEAVEGDEAIAALVEASGLTVSRSDPTNNNAGTYTLLYSVTDANYQVSRAEGDEDVYTIAPKPAEALTVTLTLPTTAPTYTGAAQAPTFSVKDGETTLPANQFTLAYLPCDEEGVPLADLAEVVLPDEPSAGAAVEPSAERYQADAINAGYYLVKAVPVEGGNYSGESGNAEQIFQIAPALLNVYVTPQQRDYTGAEIAVGDVAVAYSGLVGADASKAQPFGNNFKVAYADAGVEGAAHINAATYDLVITANAEGMSDDQRAAFANYTFTPLPGTLTVKPLDITVKPTDNHKDFGAVDPVPMSTVDATAALEADRVNIVNAYTISREEGEEIADYTISLTKKADADLTDAQKKTLANYNITLGTAKFSIVAGTLYVYAESKSKVYGAEDPEFTVLATTAAGTPVELTTTPAVKVKVGEEILDEIPTAAGTYVLIVEDGAAAEGYTNIVKLNGQYTIIPKPLTPVIEPQTLEAGDALDPTKVTFTGLVEGDEIDYTLEFNELGDDVIVYDEEAEVWVIKEGAENATYATGIKIARPDEIGEGYANANYDIDWTKTAKLVIGEGEAVVGGVEISGKDAIEEHQGETQNVVIDLGVRTRSIPATTAHTWAKETWNTMVLPFDVTVAELSEQLGYAIVNLVDADNTTEGNVVFKLEMQSIPANVPFCVKTAGAIPDNKKLYFDNKLIVAGDPSVDAGQGYKFVGTYEELTIDNTKPLFYFLRGDNAKWAHIGASSANTWKVVPFDAYVDQSGSASARELTFTFQEIDGSYTAIRSIEANTNDIESAKTGLYTIGGMKLQGAPTQKGIYIKDGKKIVIK